MKAHLMYPDRDFDPGAPLPAQAKDLIQDLELETLLATMAAGDDRVHEVSRTALLTSLEDPDRIEYRQQVLADCLQGPAMVEELYRLAVEAITGERKIYGGFLRHPGATLSRSVDVMRMFLPLLRQLRRLADQHVDAVRSPGFAALLRTLLEELDDDFFAAAEEHLDRLTFRQGVLVSARLGPGNRGLDYTLRRPRRDRPWLHRMGIGGPQAYTYRVPDRDESGSRALSQLRDRGLSLAADALAQSVDHVLGFFRMLRIETAFYLGCLNLYRQLTALGASTCFPRPAATGSTELASRGLYDICLALTAGTAVVGQDVDAAGAGLVVVTGANRGGKSTFLRSVGLAQLMMQAGMFVGADTFRSGACRGVFTHYRREEDAGMASGKFDEELSRMSGLVDHLAAGSLLLCNESFASTNEREGSQLARQVIGALLDAGVRVLIVTHLYDLAHRWYADRGDGTYFLRAERNPDGSRPYRLTEGEPLPTSFGEDLYRRIFAEDQGARPAPDTERGPASSATARVEP
jgi:hypothetical protein